MRAYAIMHNGEWYVAELVTASTYEKDQSDFEEPVWSELRTTAYLCKHTEAEEIIPLRRTI